jgi:hypothetical protein
MSDPAEKRPRGRPEGWRKPATMNSRIPAMRIPDHLEEWLQVEAERKGLSISDMARMLLLEIKSEKMAIKATGEVLGGKTN